MCVGRVYAENKKTTFKGEGFMMFVMILIALGFAIYSSP
jgi:hypothetical protein